MRERTTRAVEPQDFLDSDYGDRLEELVIALVADQISFSYCLFMDELRRGAWRRLPRVGQARRARGRLTALVLPVVVLFTTVAGSAQLTSTRSVAAGVTYRYYMDVVSPRTTLCFGEKVRYKVVVNRTADGPTDDPVPVSGVKVEAYADNRAIGTFAGQGKGGSVFVSTELDFSTPYSAEFTFTAGKKEGSTTLQFQGLVSYVSPVGRGYVSFEVPIKVIACKYMVSTVVRFPPNATYNPDAVEPPIVATMKPTLLTADADGNFTGTGMLHWKGSTFKSGCVVSQHFSADTGVALSGSVLDDHLDVRMIYEPANGPLLVSCDGVSNSAPSIPVQLDQLDVELSPKGGSLKQPQAHTSGTFLGNVFVTVRQVKGG